MLELSESRVYFDPAYHKDKGKDVLDPLCLLADHVFVYDPTDALLPGGYPSEKLTELVERRICIPLTPGEKTLDLLPFQVSRRELVSDEDFWPLYRILTGTRIDDNQGHDQRTLDDLEISYSLEWDIIMTKAVDAAMVMPPGFHVEISDLFKKTLSLGEIDVLRQLTLAKRASLPSELDLDTLIELRRDKASSKLRDWTHRTYRKLVALRDKDALGEIDEIVVILNEFDEAVSAAKKSTDKWSGRTVSILSFFVTTLLSGPMVGIAALVSGLAATEVVGSFYSKVTGQEWVFILAGSQ